MNKSNAKLYSIVPFKADGIWYLKLGYCFDIVTEYAPQEMTIDEIEKELKYEVKIIKKENDDE